MRWLSTRLSSLVLETHAVWLGPERIHHPWSWLRSHASCLNINCGVSTRWWRNRNSLANRVPKHVFMRRRRQSTWDSLDTRNRGDAFKFCCKSGRLDAVAMSWINSNENVFQHDNNTIPKLLTWSRHGCSSRTVVMLRKLSLMRIHDDSRVSAAQHSDENVTVREWIQSLCRSLNKYCCRL